MKSIWIICSYDFLVASGGVEHLESTDTFGGGTGTWDFSRHGLMELAFLSSWNRGQSMPDLQNLGWSTKLRKLFTESHCVNCYVSSLWKVASYSTMAPSFLVGSKDQCLGILEILPIKRRGKRRNHRWSFVWKIRGNTSQQRWRCYPPLLSQRKRERRPLSDFRFQWKFEGSLEETHPGSFAAGLRLGWLYQLMWCRIQTWS